MTSQFLLSYGVIDSGFAPKMPLISIVLFTSVADPGGIPLRNPILSFFPLSAHVGHRRPRPSTGNPGSATAHIAKTIVKLENSQLAAGLRWPTATWGGPKCPMRPPIGHLGLGSMVHPGLKWPTNLKV